MPEFFLADGTGCVNLVSENKERNLGKLFNRKQSIQFSFGLCKTFKLGTVDQKDDAVDFREVVAP